MIEKLIEKVVSANIEELQCQQVLHEARQLGCEAEAIEQLHEEVLSASHTEIRSELGIEGINDELYALIEDAVSEML